jgi:mannosyltransferase OCH1-like enzyme
MIPRTIHYCWFGGRPYPKIVRECMETWKRHLQGYDFILWNEKNSPMDLPYVEKAYKKKKYAFVSDYVRFLAIYEYGGIYLDTDMYMVKSLDNLLHNEIFFGFESPESINAAIFGSVKKHEFIKLLIDHYSTINFDYKAMFDLLVPKIVSKKYDCYEEKDTIKVYPSEHFYPLPYKRKPDVINFLTYKTKETYAIHLWSKSWYTLYDRIYRIPYKIKKKVKKYL